VRIAIRNAAAPKHRVSHSGDHDVGKSWNKPVILALEEPGKFTEIRTLEEASWALIEDWPLEEGPALDKALLVFEAAMSGKKSMEAARLAFIAAAIEAGLEIKD
jgi:hypothetical protein